MSARPTLESVAEHARVSRQTVSNVINTPHVVRPDTADRVRAAIDELGYRPSRAARQLRTRRSMTLGLRLEPDRGGVNGAVLDRFLHAVVEGAQRASYRVLLYTAPDDGGEIATYEDLRETSDLDGFVLTSTHHGDPRTAWLTSKGIPFSTFGRPWGEPDPQHSWVDVDGAAGTQAATHHLLEQGHRRIAFIGWPAGSGVGDDRREGWQRTMGAAARPLRDLVGAVEDSVDGGAQVTRDLLSRADPPTAFVCASDSLALGVLREAGRSVAVTGFDDTPVAAAVGLTSVAQPVVAAADLCLAQVLELLDTPLTEPRTALLPPGLAVRGSTPPLDQLSPIDPSRRTP